MIHEYSFMNKCIPFENITLIFYDDTSSEWTVFRWRRKLKLMGGRTRSLKA